MELFLVPTELLYPVWWIIYAWAFFVRWFGTLLFSLFILVRKFSVFVISYQHTCYSHLKMFRNTMLDTRYFPKEALDVHFFFFFVTLHHMRLVWTLHWRLYTGKTRWIYGYSCGISQVRCYECLILSNYWSGQERFGHMTRVQWFPCAVT